MHYLDYAATTPVPAPVAEVMVKVLTEDFGNPSAQYPLGRAARDLVEESRAAVAEALGAKPQQLLFTSCGTESDNWAIRAALWQNRRVGKHIVATAVEHSAVLQCLKALEQEGYEVTLVKPDSTGRITAEQMAAALREDTALVSMMLVNNETGVRFPVEEVAALLKNRPTLLHTDAIQGFLKVPFTAAALGADFIALSGHKVGAPKGIGALYVGGKMKNPRPLLYGGGQESGLRPGTEPVAQMAGFAEAVRRRKATMAEDTSHMAACRDYVLAQTADIPGLVRIGEGSVPHILSLSLTGYPSQNIVSDLGEKGILISAGSACHKGKASHVLTAMGLPKKTAAGTIRVSFGPETTREDLDAFVSALREHQRARFPML